MPIYPILSITISLIDGIDKSYQFRSQAIEIERQTQEVQLWKFSSNSLSSLHTLKNSLHTLKLVQRRANFLDTTSLRARTTVSSRVKV